MDKLSLCRYFKNSAFYNNKFINRSKIQFVYAIAKALTTISFTDLANLYLEFINDNNYFVGLEKPQINSVVNTNFKNTTLNKFGKN